MMRSAPSTAWRNGFTIVELLVVMAILGVLAAAVLPLGEAVVRSQQETELRRALWELRDAIDAYKRASDRGAIAAETESGYPATLEALVAGAAKANDGSAIERLYFLRRIPRNPLAHAGEPTTEAWQLRSYSSPPDKPAPGPDVFDVRSAIGGTALDGTDYTSW
jgi:general secretion pathway protein G